MSKEAKMVFENRIRMKMADRFPEYQADMINGIIEECLAGFNMELGAVEEYSSEELLNSYLTNLEISGRSKKTINRYEYIIRRLINKTNVPVQDMSVMHIRDYLGSEKDRGVANSTLDGIRQVFSAFFGWLNREGLILHNPVSNISVIKQRKKIKEIYSEIDIEKLKNNSKTIRDKAIVCFLYSTGCRISELTQLNRNDININSQECKVLGKGNKERTVYFDAITGLAIEQYLKQREDTNEALFVANKKPYIRMKPDGIRTMLHELAKGSNVKNVHPHKFRRTRATKLVKHGMPIQEVAAILGHEKLDTTMRYVVMDQNDIKNAYQKYV